MKYDLHIHSTVTDGKHSRNEILKLAKDRELEYIAFTEHNNYVETESDDIQIVNGIEFDVKFEQSFHLLCYFPKITIEIENLLKKYCENTSESTKKLVESIQKHFEIKDSFNYDNIPSKNGYKTKRDVISWLVNNNNLEEYELNLLFQHIDIFLEFIEKLNNNGYCLNDISVNIFHVSFIEKLIKDGFLSREDVNLNSLNDDYNLFKENNISIPDSIQNVD